MKFENYYIADEIKKNLGQLGFKRPTDIQYKSIPSIMKGEDVLAIAQTGTGKTAAFAIPVINKIHTLKSSKRSYGIKCIVMVPTRELAVQIGDVFNSLARHTKAKAFIVYGGVEQDAQIKKLQDGIDILVATPGRMFDLISQGYIKLKNVDTLILDEADHMLDLGFINDIKYVKKMLTRKHQTLFFSATINKEIKKLAFSQVKNSAIRIQVSPEDPVSKNVSHFVMFVEMDDKRFFLEKFIKDHPESKIIVFVRTRVRAERVAKAMERVQIEAFTIHGEKEQNKRSDVMQKFKHGDFNLLIATDVSARGIDIADVNYVINYDLPDKAENYVHRVGRTGRGVNKGIAVSFCSTQEKNRLLEIQQFLNKEIEVIKTSKQDYAHTIETTAAVDDIQTLIESFENRKKRKKKNQNNIKMKFLFIETFSIGSHALFANGLVAHSTHTIDLIEMSGENYRWRMLGAALYMAGTIPNIDKYDGIIVTDLFNLADFKALVGAKCPPVMVYFHENQLTYPQPIGDKSVFMLGMINITTALAADMVLFNSTMHKNAFLKAIPEFLNRGRDFTPKGIAEKIRQKSNVLYPGITLPPFSKVDSQKQTDPPLIVWNHRWGFDKNHPLFFNVLEKLQEQGFDFQLALMGENFGKIPKEFLAAQHIFKDKIVQFGYVPSRAEYIKWLKQGTIVISTAIQENFGMSVIEAIIMGCIPLLPNRLSYPEILPEEFHEQFLYQNKYDLIEKLSHTISDVAAYEETRNKLVKEMASFLWENVIKDFDLSLEQLVMR